MALNIEEVILQKNYFIQNEGEYNVLVIMFYNILKLGLFWTFLLRNLLRENPRKFQNQFFRVTPDGFF